MSKSHPDPRSRILLTDSSDEVASKIKGAVTDSLGDVAVDYEQRPGILNLLSIYAGLESLQVDTVAQKFSGQNAGALKKEVADVVNSRLSSIRDELQRLHNDEAFLESVEQEGARRAREVASRTLEQVKQTIGLA